MYKQRCRRKKKGTHKNMKIDSEWLLKQREKKAKVRTGKGHKRMHKFCKRDIQIDVQAEPKSETTAKGEGDAHAHAQTQQERHQQRDVQSKAEAMYNAEVKSKGEGSHREAVMGKATLTKKEAKGKEKGRKG